MGKTAHPLSQIRNRIDTAVQINIEEMLCQVYIDTMVDMTGKEKKQSNQRYVMQIRIVFASDGILRLQLGD